MRKYAIAAVGLLLSVVLGATVFREPIAWAAQAISATIVGPLDSNGNVAVHEQGTAIVAVAPQAGALTASRAFSINDASGGIGNFDLAPMTVSFLGMSLSDAVESVDFAYHVTASSTRSSLDLEGPATHTNYHDIHGLSNYALPLTQPIQIDAVRLVCTAPCTAIMNLSGIRTG